MLAYGFWHWPRPGVARADYETAQRGFLAALMANPPDGFRQAATVRLAGAPWAAGGGAAYEDWYLIGAMADLEPLNDAAVTGSRKAPHDAVARLAAGGTAGLYRLRLGEPTPARHACWFSKPPGLPYQAVFDALGPAIASEGAALWMRQMVLGPTPEFCLRSGGPVEWPIGWEGLRLALDPV